MVIIENGKEVTVADALTLAELIRDKGWKAEAVIVEVNYSLVRKEEWEQTRLQNGDQIELLALVGGG